jgi:hypothetical protein
MSHVMPPLAAADLQHRAPTGLRRRAADGTERIKWVWERGSAVRGPAGNVIALEGFVSDITERKQAQEEVARLNAQLEERVRLRPRSWRPPTPNSRPSPIRSPMTCARR